MTTFSGDGQRESGQVYFQLKATDNMKLSKDGRSIAVRIERGDLKLWLREPYPVPRRIGHGGCTFKIIFTSARLKV